MLDAVARRLLDPPLDRAGAALARRRVPADVLTLLGLGAGLAAAGGVFFGAYGVALALFLGGRVLDGLDGAVARHGRATPFGGYLDIVADFAVYGAMVLAFGLAEPGANAIASAVLLFAFYVNGTSFLGLAAVAADAGLKTGERGPKALYFTAGLMEGTETVLFLTAFCLWPAAFMPLALVFAVLTLAGALARIALARRRLAGPTAQT